MANTEAAPTSNKTWLLTLYEMSRKPQEINNDSVEIKVSPRTLHSELMCPICLDMLKNTMTTKECLHRFCQECITTALRSGNKECPTCRKKLVSRRSLRPDPTFDALILKIYPNRAEYEAHQERVLAKLSKHHSTEALMNSIEEGIKMQALFRQQKSKQTRLKRTATDSPAGSLTGSEGAADAELIPAKRSRLRETAQALQSAPPAAEEIELVLYPHPESERTNESRYIKTTDNASVGHLRKYLAMRLQMDTDKDSGIKFNESMFTVAIKQDEGVYTELQLTMTLHQVNTKLWKRNRPLELYYKRSQEAAAASRLPSASL